MKLIVIGSSTAAHMRLNSPYVSGVHAELLLLDNGEILLTDRGSKNGTFIDDKKCPPDQEIPIKRGDNVRFADTVLDWRNVPTVVVDLTQVKEMKGIGTNYRNSIQLQGERVSRFHATLKKMSNGKWYIQDHSKNGTTINGQQIAKEQDVLLQKGDQILCAGVPVVNPCGGKPNKSGGGKKFPWKKVIMIILIVMGVSTTTFFGLRYFNLVSCSSSRSGTSSSSGGSRIVETGTERDDERIYEDYKNSTVLIVGFYYYKVTAGNLNLEDLGLASEVVLNSNRKIVSVSGVRSNMNSFTGTGFFVSKTGQVMTNLHIVRPWLFKDDGSYISDMYKMQLADMASIYPRLNAFIDQVKVSGVLHYIGLIPNGELFSDENIKTCHELLAGNDINIDVAMLQTVTKRLPNENSTYVDMESAVVKDADIKVGAHIYTMGFPLGLSLQDLNSSKGIQLLAHGGNITQDSSDYSFGFDAASYGGASGSPIFNKKGQLIGVLNAGVSQVQGFNYAIKAKYAKALYDQVNKK